MKKIDLDICKAKTLSGRFYTSKTNFNDSIEKIFANSWQFISDDTMLQQDREAQPFQFLDNIIPERLVLINNKGKINCFSNVCTHRGSRICLEQEGSKKLLVCPYHAWSFSAEGELKAARHMPDDFRLEDYGLRKCHMKIYEWLIFINLSMEDPMDFDEFMSPLKVLVNFHGTGKSKIVARKKYPTDANFKLVLENFQECYHCSNAHPEFSAVHEKDWVFTMGAGLGTAPEKDTDEYLKKIVPWVEECKKQGTPSETYLETDEGLRKGLNRYFERTPIGNGHLSQTKNGKPASKLMGKFKDFDGGLSQVSFNPFSCCYFTNDFGIMFVFKPSSILKSEVELIWLVNEDAEEGRDYNTDDVTYIWDVTTQEDTTIIENNQKGLLSQSFAPGVLSQNESAVTYFYNWYFTNMQLS